MGTIALKDQLCPKHDGHALQIYDDGSAHCFNAACRANWGAGQWCTSSGEYLGKGRARSSVKDDGDQDGFEERRPMTKVNFKDPKLAAKIYQHYHSDDYELKGISEEVMEFYKCKVGYGEDGEQDSVYYAYNLDEKGIPQAYKKRVLPKDFSEGNVGVMGGLFGWGLFKDKASRLVITEGEDDCLAIADVYYKKYDRFLHVMSLRSSTATKDLVEVREYIRDNYEEVILWMDNDEPGRKAEKEAAKILGYDITRVVHTQHKDAGDYLKAEGEMCLRGEIVEAIEYSPASILNGDTLWERLATYNEKPCVPYPPFMEGLNEKLRGMRMGEITLWTSGTGSGKSTLMREIMYHLVTGKDEDGNPFVDSENRIGVVSLEESPEETSRKLAGMAINRNPAFEDIPLEDLKPGFDEVFGAGNILVLDHQGSIGDGSIMDHLEFMCLKGCKYLFVDHITILVSEGAEGLHGNEAIDKVMNDMLKLVKKHDVWMGLISHLRKANNDQKSFEQGKIPSLDDIKGSGSIKQISFDVIGFARNQESDNEEERNTVNTKVLKCRYTGKTGPSGAFQYDHPTGRMVKGDDSFMKGGKYEEV